ncbi:MAG: SpoVR family protein, partial [Pseudomonas proteolytica]
EEDRYWFPDYAGTNWVDTLHFAMQNFKDESFISQFLSPKVMREMKLFAIDDDDLKNYLKVSAIHNEEGYRLVRNTLSAQYNLSNLEPNIQVYNVAVKGDRSLTLRYVPHNRIPLGDSRHEVLRHLHQLWGFDVVLEQDNGDLPADIIGRCPDKKPL